jgi:hypothetical protein
MSGEEVQGQLQELRERLERIEQYLGMAGWRPRPDFDPQKFHRILLGYLAWLFTLFFVVRYVC